MLKFFFADYAGVFLLGLFIAGGLFIYKGQRLYGGLPWVEVEYLRHSLKGFCLGRAWMRPGDIAPRSTCT